KEGKKGEREEEGKGSRREREEVREGGRKERGIEGGGKGWKEGGRERKVGGRKREGERKEGEEERGKEGGRKDRGKEGGRERGRKEGEIEEGGREEERGRERGRQEGEREERRKERRERGRRRGKKEGEGRREGERGRQKERRKGQTAGGKEERGREERRKEEGRMGERERERGRQTGIVEGFIALTQAPEANSLLSSSQKKSLNPTFTSSLPPQVCLKAPDQQRAPSFSIAARTKSRPPQAPAVCFCRPPAFSMLKRLQKPTRAFQTPGPGAHSPEKVTVHRTGAPSYSFGVRHSEYLMPFIPDAPEW
ncbi:Zinc finger CCCH domain-containing protein 13, partial [Ophiophagus hannah]